MEKYLVLPRIKFTKQSNVNKNFKNVETLNTATQLFRGLERME